MGGDVNYRYKEKEMLNQGAAYFEDREKDS